MITDWLAPVLVGLSMLALARAFYILYILRCGTRLSAIFTWAAAILVVAFWTWRIV